MTEATLQTIDDFWSNDVGCSHEQLRAERTILVAHPDHYADFMGIFILLVGTSPIISLPRELYLTLASEAQTWSASDILDGGRLRSLIGDRVDGIIGPAFIGYTERGMFCEFEAPMTIVLNNTHATAVSTLRAACDPAEWEHVGGDLGGSVSIGIFVGEELVALARYSLWGVRIAHISIVTHPHYRQRGYGRAAVSQLTKILLDRNLIPKYRALDNNIASMKLAARLGFIRYATTMTVRLHSRS
jgi:GNAT superfamily N-acetyltransferase